MDLFQLLVLLQQMNYLDNILHHSQHMQNPKTLIGSPGFVAAIARSQRAVSMELRPGNESIPVIYEITVCRGSKFIL